MSLPERQYRYTLINNSPTIYSDWYLPSHDEAQLLITVLYNNGIGNLLGSPYFYWTSSEFDNNDAYAILFFFGIIAWNAKSNPGCIRAIRSFTTTDNYNLKDTGPSGGWIIYKNVNYYIEAAPCDSPGTLWSNITGTAIGNTDKIIGSGYLNTLRIIEQPGQTSSAALTCVNLTVLRGLTSLILTYAPEEWQSDQAFWERSMTYFGIFRSFSTSELTIIKDGAEFLKTIFEADGTEALCMYQVESMNTTTYQYQVIYSGIVDFSTYKYIPGNMTTFDKVKVQIIDNDFINRIKTRESQSVSLPKLVDMYGNAIIPFTHEGTSVLIPSRVDTETATFAGLLSATTPLTVAFPFTVQAKEDSSVINVSDITKPTLIAGAFFAPDCITPLTINLNLTGTVQFSNAQSLYVNFNRYNTSGTLQETQNVGNYSVSSSPWVITLTVWTTVTFATVNIGDYVVLAIQYSATPVSVALNAASSHITNISYQNIIYPDSTILAYPYHEAFTRILQSITGTIMPFYSTLLGRTDSELTTYPSDGAMSLGVITNGLLIRYFTFTDPDIDLNTSLKDLFTALHSTFPLSLGIETVNGNQVVRIESMSYAFQSSVFLTVENASEISEEVANDLTFSAIHMGFTSSKDAYNQNKGRFEYNAKTDYSTPITRQQNELNNVSPYRGDTNGIVSCLVKSKTEYSSTDTASDNDNFIIKCVRNSGFQIARTEGYTVLGNLENSVDTYNLDYSPARSARNWGSFFRGFLDKYASKVISFITSKNNSTAYTQKTGESAPIYENQDIQINSLNTPFFENIYYNFNMVVNSDVMTAINGTTNGTPNYYFLVRFRNKTSDDYKYGWVMRFESKKPGLEGQGTMKLLKASTDITDNNLLNEVGVQIMDQSNNNITVTI